MKILKIGKHKRNKNSLKVENVITELTYSTLVLRVNDQYRLISCSVISAERSQHILRKAIDNSRINENTLN